MATTGTKVPSIYKVPTKADPELKLFADSVKEALEVRLGRRGDPRDRAITLRELIESGMAKELLDNPFDPNAGVGTVDFTGNTLTDFTIPPTPTGFSVAAAYTSFILSWDNPQMSNFANTEVWRSTTNNLGAAVKVDTTSAFVWSEEVGYAKTFYYWVRHVSTSGVEGAFSPSSNHFGTTSIDIAAVMTTLGDTLADLPGYTTLTNLINSSSSSGAIAATVIRATSAPSTRSGGGSLQANDLWIDTDDNNQLYVRNAANNGWEEARDGTLVTLVNSINTQQGTNTTAIATANTNIATLTTANTARVSDISTINSTINDSSTGLAAAHSAIASEATNRATADTANATNITNLTSTINDSSSGLAAAHTAITNEATTRASADTTNATNITNLTSTINNASTGLAAAHTAITNEATTRASADSANATAISTLETNTNTALGTKATTASVTAVQNALSNGTSAQAGYGVAVNANGAIAGMYIMANSSGTLQNNTSTTNIIFEAGQVTIRNPHGSNAVPFTVLTSTDGAGNPAGVYIDTGFIKNAAITSAQIGSLSANLVNAVNINADSIDSGTLSADRIAANSISGGKISADSLSIDGKAIGGSIGTINGTTVASASIYEYGELYRPAWNSTGRRHIADTTQTTGSDSGESGSIPAITADSSILGLSPIMTFGFTTFNWGSGTRKHLILFAGNISGSAAGSGYRTEGALALSMRATTSATDYTSTSGYVFSTGKTMGGDTAVIGSQVLSEQADLQPNTTYYVWLFAGVDDISNETLYDSSITVLGLNK